MRSRTGTGMAFMPQPCQPTCQPTCQLASYMFYGNSLSSTITCNPALRTETVRAPSDAMPQPRLPSVSAQKLSTNIFPLRLSIDSGSQTSTGASPGQLKNNNGRAEWKACRMKSVLRPAPVVQPFVFDHTPVGVFLAIFFGNLRTQKHNDRREYTRRRRWEDV